MRPQRIKSMGESSSCPWRLRNHREYWHSSWANFFFGLELLYSANFFFRRHDVIFLRAYPAVPLFLFRSRQIRPHGPHRDRIGTALGLNRILLFRSTLPYCAHIFFYASPAVAIFLFSLS